MNPSDQREAMSAPVAPSSDVQTMLDALRRAGADQADPARFRYIEVLARRASADPGRVQRILEGKLIQAMAALSERLAQAPRDAPSDGALAHGQRRRETLGDLVRHMAQQSTERVDGRLDAAVTPRAELKSVRYFRNTWSRLSAQKQVTQALDRAPKNAGPINSHRVALQSLALMRDASPDYLNRFMCYVDTLLCLDQGDQGTQAHAKAAANAESGKKIKTGRARSR